MFDKDALQINPVFVEVSGKPKIYLQTEPYVESGRVIIKRLATIEDVKVIDVESVEELKRIIKEEKLKSI